MRIYLSPQISERRIHYTFSEQSIKIRINEVEETFDFSNVPDGKLLLYNEETGEDLIKTKLSVNPLVSVEKIKGVLYVKLLNWLPENAPKKDLFPTWIDATEYTPPESSGGRGN